MRRVLPLCAVPLLLLGVLPIIAGCGGGGEAGGGDIEGVVWVLESYADGGGRQSIPDGVRIDALFEGGRVSGSSGINTYSASYETSGSSLSIGLVVSTEMAGPEDIMALERAYLDALQKASSYRATQDDLTIFADDGGELLVYTRQKAANLTGGTWKASGYNNGRGGVVSAIVGSELTAVFSEDGTVSGSSGVNTFSGGYTLDGDKITIGPLASTLMAAEDPRLMEQEAAYLAALQSASLYRIRGTQLELRREDGALAVSYDISP